MLSLSDAHKNKTCAPKTVTFHVLHTSSEMEFDSTHRIKKTDIHPFVTVGSKPSVRNLTENPKGLGYLF